MPRLILKCPACSGKLNVTKLGCPTCCISIDGDFTLPPLLQLAPAQLDFVEVFIKNRGVIRDVERELGISYPTVRARLDEVIEALGYQARGEADSDRPSDGAPRTDAAELRRRVLADLKAGNLGPEDALAALRRGRRRNA